MVMKTMIKKRYLHLSLLIIFMMSGFGLMTLQAQTSDSLALANLKSVDPGLLPYFPRWSVCEPNLQLQIFQVFKLDGRSAENLDMRSIQITSAPSKIQRILNSISCLWNAVRKK